MLVMLVVEALCMQQSCQLAGAESPFPVPGEELGHFLESMKKPHRVKCQQQSGTVVAEAAECDSLSFSASLCVSAGRSALGALAGALWGRALWMLSAPSTGIVGHYRSQRGKILILPLFPRLSQCVLLRRIMAFVWIVVCTILIFLAVQLVFCHYLAKANIYNQTSGMNVVIIPR